MWTRTFIAAIFLLIPTMVSAQNAGQGQSEKRLLYVVTPGIRDYLEFGGAGILVFDIDHGHKFVKRIETSASSVAKPRNIKGVCASAITNRLYFTTPESLYCVDLANEKTLWEVSPKDGCDRMSITPDGKLLYVPSFEKDTWHVIDADSGKLLQEIETKSGAHNTVVSQDGSRMFLGGLKSPYLFIADTRTHQVVGQAGPLGGAVRPFTVNGFRTRAYVCVNELLGFEVADLTSGKLLHRVEVTGFKAGPVKRHGCPSHGIGLTPNEREVWVVDAANQQLHVFDNTASPPKQMQSLAVREQPGWITFSRDGAFVYPSTGEVIDAKTKKIIATLTDEMGREVHSEKMIEIHRRGAKATIVGDQFGVGRVVAQFERGGEEKIATSYAQAVRSVNMPTMFTQQYYSQPAGNPTNDEQLIQQAVQALNFSFLDSVVQTSDHANVQLIKLNLVASNEQIAAKVPEVVAKAYGAESVPAISIVVGALPAGAAVGVDAVAVYKRPVERVSLHTLEAAPGLAKISPAGSRVYIAGQAEKGSSPAMATAQTIEGLKRTLEWLGCDLKDILQAKCFLTPMTAADEVRAEFEKAFPQDRIPLVFVEWKSDLPIEIELIAFAKPSSVPTDAPAIEFLTPPWMKASPIYSRVVRVNRGDWIYTSGLAHSSTDANQQVTGVFDQLKSIFSRNGSNFEHLAKATYYVSSEATSKSLNELRPKYYDPKTPPAASKAMIPALPGKNVHLQIDMIGIVDR